MCFLVMKKPKPTDNYAFANDKCKMTEAEFLAVFASIRDAENG